MAGKSETFIKLGLVFFISLLSFAIGTLVGKEYSDRQYKLSKMEPTEHASAHREVASEHPASKLSDEEIAKLSEEFMTDDSVEQAKDSHGEHGKAPAIETKTAAHHGQHEKVSPEFEEMNDAALEAAQSIIDGKLPAPASNRKVANATTETTTPLPQSLPKNAAQDTVGKWTVQVGSFVKEEEAKSRAEKLKSKGYNAFYLPGTVEGKTWFRVNVGTFATLEEAKRANEKFTADNGGQKGFVKQIVN